MSKLIENIILKFIKRNLFSQIVTDIRTKIMCEVIFERDDYYERTSLFIKRNTKFGERKEYIRYIYDCEIFEYFLKYEILIKKIFEDMKERKII